MKKKFLVTTCLLATLVMCGCGEDKSKASYDAMYEHLVYCWKQSLEGVHFDYAFYGDSRVIGGDFAGEFAEKSVVNLGVGGDRIRNLIDRFGLIKTVTPNKVFLAIGGNDVLSGNYKFEKFSNEYTELLQMFKDINVDVVVHNVVGLTTANSNFKASDVEKLNNELAEANKIIKQKAEEFSFEFLDIASLMNKEGTNEMNPDYSADGAHFNQKGYEVWFSALDSYFD